jgi:nucleoside-diphosphate-sugar epimerase
MVAQWTAALRSERLLVTGGRGFIGQAVCAALEREQISVLAPGREELDLLNPVQVAGYLSASRPTQVLHLAGSTNRSNDLAVASHLTQTNVLGTLNLLQHAPVGTRLIHTGTLDEYGAQAAPFAETMAPSPLTPYAASKAAAGLFVCLAGGLHVRLSLVYGPGQKATFFVAQLLRSLLEDTDFAMTAGEQVRDLIYVDDVVEGLLRLAASPWPPGQVVNLCRAQGCALKDLVRIAKKVAARPGRVHLGAIAYRPTEVFEVVGSSNRLQEWLAWAPVTSLEDGLGHMLLGPHPTITNRGELGQNGI